MLSAFHPVSILHFCLYCNASSCLCLTLFSTFLHLLYISHFSLLVYILHFCLYCNAYSFYCSYSQLFYILSIHLTLPPSYFHLTLFVLETRRSSDLKAMSFVILKLCHIKCVFCNFQPNTGDQKVKSKTRNQQNSSWTHKRDEGQTSISLGDFLIIFRKKGPCLVSPWRQV